MSVSLPCWPCSTFRIQSSLTGHWVPELLESSSVSDMVLMAARDCMQQPIIFSYCISCINLSHPSSSHHQSINHFYTAQPSCRKLRRLGKRKHTPFCSLVSPDTFPYNPFPQMQPKIHKSLFISLYLHICRRPIPK